MAGGAAAREAGAQGSAQASAQLPADAGWILAAVTLGEGILILLATAVSNALPRIQHDFGTSLAAAAWVYDAFTVLLAALLLAGGALGDRFGRKRLFAIGLAIYGLAAIGCALAPGLGWLIAARAAQSIGAACFVPQALAIITALWPPGRRGPAIGTWIALSGLGAAIGPIAGGWLVDAFSWRWLFVLVVPLVAANLVLLLRYVPETHDRRRRGRIDLLGAALCTLGLGGITFAALQAGRGAGWRDPLVPIALGVGAAALMAFVIVEARRAHPLLPLGLFRSRAFAGANAVTLLLYFALDGALFMLTFDLQQVQGYSALLTGLALLPLSAILLGFSRLAGRVARRTGPRLLVVGGCLISAAGCALMLLVTPGVAFWTVLLPAQLVFSLGIAAAVTPLTNVAMSAAPRRESGVASGVNNAVSTVAAALSIAILTLIAAARFGPALARNLTPIPISTQARQQLLDQRDRLGATQVPADVAARDVRPVRRAIADAFTAAFRLTALVCAALALLAAAITVVTVPGRFWSWPGAADSS